MNKERLLINPEPFKLGRGSYESRIDELIDYGISKALNLAYMS
jgi:hypothetical protein